MSKDVGRAIAYEEEGVKMYSEFANKFQSPVFSEILAVKNAGLNILKGVDNTNPTSNEEGKTEEEGKKKETVSNKPDLSGKNYSLIDSEKDALFTAISYEIEGQKIYEQFAKETNDENIKDLYFRLWATSSNEYKEALMLNLNSPNLNEANQNNQYSKHLNPNDMGFAFNEVKDLKDTFAKLADGSVTSEDLAKVLQSPNISFVSGALLGAFGGVLINQLLGKKDSKDN